MQTQDHSKIVSSGGPESHGVHLCHKCGWAFPNPHPSAKHRRAHKRVCGTNQGQKTRLDGSDDEHLSDDDSKTPSVTAVEKSVGVSMTRRSSSGVGSRSSRSTRSDEDMFSDAVTEFGEVPAVADSSAVTEPADTTQNFSEDVAIVELDLEKAGADSGDLYPVNSNSGTHVLDVECPIPEIERAETDLPSAHHSSTPTLVYVSNSGFDAGEKEASSSKNNLQSSEFAAVLAAEEKGTLDKKSEDNAAKSLEADVLPQKLNGDNKEFIPAGAAMEQIANQGEGCGDKDDYFPKVNFVGQINGLEEGLVEAALGKKSGDIAYVPADNASKTSETVSVLQKGNEDNLEIHANPTMEVKETQGDGFDANNDCFPAADFVGQPNTVEEDSNVEVGNSLGVFDSHDSCSNTGHVLAIPDVLPLKDHEIEKLPDGVTLDLAKEVEYAEHGKDYVNREIFLSSSLAEPSESPKTSTNIISEVSDKEDNFAQELSVEMESVETGATDQGEIVTYPQEQNSLVFVDANLQSVMDDSGNLVHSIKPVQYDKMDAHSFDSLEADSTKKAEEKFTTSSDSGEVEKLSESIRTVAQSDELTDDKVTVQKDEEHGSGLATLESSEAGLLKCDFQMTKLQDSETVVKDLSSSSEQHVNLLGSTIISDTDNNANMTEQTLIGENRVLNNDTQQDENEVSEDAKEKDGSGSDFAVGNGNLGKLEKVVPELDVQVDSVSQTDSLEGNQGSVSVLSDAPVATETGSQRLQSSVMVENVSLQPKANNGKSDVFKQPYPASPEHKADVSGQNEGAPEAQTSEKTSLIQPVASAANESSGSKRNEEIIAKVTNWSTASGKEHVSLKSILGEAPPNDAKDNHPLEPQEAEKINIDTKEAATEEMPKEWNYPTDMKKEKGKGRSRLHWAPFFCCSSSLQTS